MRVSYEVGADARGEKKEYNGFSNLASLCVAPSDPGAANQIRKGLETMKRLTGILCGMAMLAATLPGHAQEDKAKLVDRLTDAQA